VLTFGNQNYAVLLLYQKQYQNDNKARKKIEDMPQLTVLAAAALGAVMVLAISYHVWRGEFSSIGMNILLGAVAAFIAWGRLRKAPITVG
jgi:hypothetical protein